MLNWKLSLNAEFIFNIYKLLKYDFNIFNYNKTKIHKNRVNVKKIINFLLFIEIKLILY